MSSNMVFDFGKAIQQSAEALSSPLVGAILLGASGSGKSRAMGSLGVKTLYLYGSGENHGPQSASLFPGADIVPMCYDYLDGKVLSPDQAYQFLLAILRDHASLKSLGIKAIALDGVTELEAIIRSSEEWKERCKTKDNKHNTFGEGPATLAMFREVFAALKDLQRELKVHYVLSCILEVKSTDSFGEIEEASPSMQGYSVADGVVRQFGDILVIGKMKRADEIKYKFQFLTDLSKVSKDAVGSVKKVLSFSPRLAGVKQIPNLMDADLSKVIERKKESSKA